MNISKKIKEAARSIKSMASEPEIVDAIRGMADALILTFESGGKLIVCGNGGSASQAEHIAGEFVGKFYKERKALPAIALTGPTATLTAVANDYGYKRVFSRQIEALGKPGDFLLCLTTSGMSENVINVVNKSRQDIKVAALTGGFSTPLHPLCDFSIRVPSTDTARIQEAHLLIGHMLAEIVEDEMFPSRDSQ